MFSGSWAGQQAWESPHLLYGYLVYQPDWSELLGVGGRWLLKVEMTGPQPWGIELAWRVGKEWDQGICILTSIPGDFYVH